MSPRNNSCCTRKRIPLPACTLINLQGYSDNSNIMSLKLRILALDSRKSGLITWEDMNTHLTLQCMLNPLCESTMQDKLLRNCNLLHRDHNTLLHRKPRCNFNILADYRHIYWYYCKIQVYMSRKYSLVFVACTRLCLNTLTCMLYKHLAQCIYRNKSVRLNIPRRDQLRHSRSTHSHTFQRIKLKHSRRNSSSKSCIPRANCTSHNLSCMVSST